MPSIPSFASFKSGVTGDADLGQRAARAVEGREMKRITIDAELKEKLLGLKQYLEICDESGRVVARVTPVPDVSEWEPVTPEVSEEELDRRARSDEKRYSTAEVLAHLRQL
jgi:hypothetical protein